MTKEQRREYMRQWHAENPRDRRSYKAAYDASHREANAERRRMNQAHIKLSKAAWYQANRERLIAKVEARYEAKKAEVLAYQANYYVEHTDKVKANVLAYRAANPEKKALHDNRRRVRKAGNGGTHTAAEWREKCQVLGNVCFYCGEAKPLTRDHIIPLARGGTDDITNLVPACRSCNSRKHIQTAQEFHARIGDDASKPLDSR